LPQEVNILNGMFLKGVILIILTNLVEIIDLTSGLNVSVRSDVRGLRRRQEEVVLCLLKISCKWIHFKDD
jgi:hypothetical protein